MSERTEVINYETAFVLIDQIILFMRDDRNWNEMGCFEQAKLAERCRRLERLATYRIINSHAKTALPIEAPNSHEK